MRSKWTGRSIGKEKAEGVPDGLALFRPLEFYVIDFEQLKENIQACRLCRDEFGFEPHPFFHGGRHSRIMQISQAPSRRVHGSLRPFDAPSGRNLRQWYGLDETAFYNSDNFYFSAMAHCYPGKTAKGDLPPPKRCAQWLVREMEAVDSQMYVIVGRKAAEFLFPEGEFSRLVFGDQMLKGKSALVLPHPSPRNINWLRRQDFAERLIEVRKKIHEVLDLNEAVSP